MNRLKIKVIFTIILVSLCTFLFFSYKKFIKHYAQVINLDSKTRVFKKISTLWENADYGDNKVCKPYQNTDDFFYQCNPYYISCLSKNGFLDKLASEEKLDFKFSDTYKFVTNGNFRSYEFEYSDEVGEKRTLSLLDNCHEVYLPNRFYPFLVKNRSLSYEWDNHEKNIFVDKYLVKNYEVLDYARAANKKELITIFEKLAPNFYAKNLSLKEMEDYCHYQGKEILRAEIYDAAVIYPEDIADNKSRLLRAPYYPWTRKNEDSFLYELQGSLNTTKKLEKLKKLDLDKSCRKAYGLECLNRAWIFNDRENVSWAGVYEIFGGPFEYLKNTLYPLENLKTSSKFFSLISPYHRVGSRGYWDHEGLGTNNFLFPENRVIEFDQEIEIAFRCMRKR